MLFHNITVFTVFSDQINAALVSIRDFFQIHKKNLFKTVLAQYKLFNSSVFKSSGPITLWNDYVYK